jgi:hypothetical protein
MVEQLRVLVTVKAYPSLSTTYAEAVCVAGIREGGRFGYEWVRLFPVQFRDLPVDKRFRKYDIIELSAEPHSSDQRPESRRPDQDTIRVVEHLDTTRKWARRREFVEGLGKPLTMCGVQAAQAVDGTSLAVIRPREVHDLVIRPRDEQDLSEGRRMLSRTRIEIEGAESTSFAWRPLEVSPYTYKFRYTCFAPECRTHTMSVIDWEIHQAFRNWKARYRSETDDQINERIRRQWMDDLCGPDKDTVFFVGNMHQHPASFLVLGVFWPPRV